MHYRNGSGGRLHHIAYYVDSPDELLRTATILVEHDGRSIWIDGPEEESSFMGLDRVMLKGFDGFAPMGPFITPSEFVPDPQKLALRFSVNGQVKQDANTTTMVFTVLEIIEHLTRIMTLEPGDVIATGTPSGVGFGRKPPEFLHSGDRMVAEIEGLGSLETVMQSSAFFLQHSPRTFRSAQSYQD